MRYAGCRAADASEGSRTYDVRRIHRQSVCEMVPCILHRDVLAASMIDNSSDGVQLGMQ
jgi:hypothetical protein